MIVEDVEDSMVELENAGESTVTPAILNAVADFHGPVDDTAEEDADAEDTIEDPAAAALKEGTDD